MEDSFMRSLKPRVLGRASQLGESELIAHLHGGVPEPEMRLPEPLQAADPAEGMRVALYQGDPPLQDYRPIGFGTDGRQYRVLVKHPQREHLQSLCR